MAAGIELVGLTKRFGHATVPGGPGGHVAVDNIDLSVSGGEFFRCLSRPDAERRGRCG
jgi:hypothetical protein